VRTTLSLDDDVARLLNRQMRHTGKSLKETVNHFLRLGLTAAPDQRRKHFVVTPRRMGLPAGLSYDNVAELLEQLEGATHK
jgi:hypothetical protein